jgi:RNA polymerase sigma-70 factor (ECF subfamily)
MNKGENKMFISKDIRFFAELYEKYYSGMVIFAENMVYDRDEARDIVQDVFTDLWDKPEEVHIYTKIKTYLFSCVKNKCFNRLKKLNIIDKHQELLTEAYLFSCETQTHSNEKLKKQIHDTLNNMPNTMREVLNMHVIQELKYAEIAEELRISVNSVKTHIKRAYKRFRKEVNSTILWLLILISLVFMTL